MLGEEVGKVIASCSTNPYLVRQGKEKDERLANNDRKDFIE